MRRDATRRASSTFRAFQPAGVSIERARTSPSNLFKVPHDQHAGLRVHFIYDDDDDDDDDDDEVKPRRENAAFAACALGEKKRGGLLDNVHSWRKRRESMAEELDL